MRAKLPSKSAICWITLLLMPLLIVTTFVATGGSAISPTSAPRYESLGNVTYKIELTMEVRNKHPSYDTTVEVYVARWKNWSAEVPETTPSLQESYMQNATDYGYTAAIFNQTDQFNNIYDFYNKTLYHGPIVADKTFSLSVNYSLTAKQVRWSNLGIHTMAEYDTGSTFYQRYTEDQPTFIQTSDPNIQGNASAICGTESNPVEKARKIYRWVAGNLNYEMQEGSGTGEKGASWALANLIGDCSEYSDLMVALLRAQGVPARKVVGLALLAEDGSPLPSYSIGSSWYYMKSLDPSFNNITGHAWVEYYVEGVGWISCDPTWGANRTDDFYFNYQDYMHIAGARGEYFGNEVKLPISPEVEEYQVIPYIELHGSVLVSDISFNTRIAVTVTDNHMWVDATMLMWFVVILVIIAAVAIIYWVASSRKN